MRGAGEGQGTVSQGDEGQWSVSCHSRRPEAEVAVNPLIVEGGGRRRAWRLVDEGMRLHCVQEPPRTSWRRNGEDKVTTSEGGDRMLEVLTPESYVGEGRRHTQQNRILLQRLGGGGGEAMMPQCCRRRRRSE